MGKQKLTYEQVYQAFNERGYELLEKEYINTKTKMRFKCPNHSDKFTEIKYEDIKRGRGCKYCAGTVKYTYEEVKDEFEKRGYVLIDTEYTSAKQKLSYICPKHPDKESSIGVTTLKRGHGCPYCAGRGKPTFAEVKHDFEKRGYELLETEYINNRTKMRFRCPTHPDANLTISYGNLTRGQGCRLCKYDKARSYTYDDVVKLFNSRGYTLVTREYKRMDQILYYKCPHHPDKRLHIRLQGILRGEGCRYCADKRRSETYSGENAHAWKGGLTELNNYLRRVIKDWKIESLEAYEYKCALTRLNNGDLEIHHTKQFSVIRDEVLEELNLSKCGHVGEYSQTELDLIVSKLQERHKEVVGIPLCKDIHTLFHIEYGRKNTNFEQYDEFRFRYYNGEFDGILEAPLRASFCVKEAIV